MMMMRTSTLGWIAGTVLLLAAQMAPAQDGHVLAVKEDGFPQAPGSKITTETTVEIVGAKMTLKMGDQTQEGTMTRKETRVEKMEVLSPTKARRIMESAKVEGGIKMGDQDRPIPQAPTPLEKVPMIVEFKDGKYSVTLEAGEPTAVQAPLLQQFSKSHGNNTDAAVYGTAPRKPGDKWDVDPKSARMMGEAEDLTGSYKVEFVEVKDFQGTPCAVLKSNFDISGKSKGSGTVNFKGSSTTIRSLADKLDLEVKVDATMTMSAQPNPTVTTRVEGPFTSVQKATVVRP